jgi:hypothetical protein
MSEIAEQRIAAPSTLVSLLASAPAAVTDANESRPVINRKTYRRMDTPLIC